MSNTVTLTFNDAIPIVGKVINLNQIDALGQQQTITFTYGTDILPLITNPFDSSIQINLNTENC